MTYATQQQMVDRFGEQEIIGLTDRTQSGVIDPTVLDQALRDADSEIDAYLSGRYKLPLANVPTVLQRIAADLARFYLYKRPHEIVQKRYDGAIGFLKAVSAGKASLDLDETDLAAAPTKGPTAAGPDRVFTDETLADF